MPTKFVHTACAISGLFSSVLALPAAAQRCGDTITVSTRLQADMHCPAAQSQGYALRISGASVVLDLGGHVIDTSGPPTSGQDVGVMIDRSPGAAVVNGTIIAAGSPNDGRAVEVRDSPGVVIDRIVVESSSRGILLRGADDATVVSSTFVGRRPFSAIVSDDSPTGPGENRRMRLLDNEMDNYGAGGTMFMLKGQSISDSVIDGNKASGIGAGVVVWAADASKLRISSNVFYAAAPPLGGMGLYLAAVNDTTVERNVFAGFGFGVFLHQYCCALLWHAPASGGTNNTIYANHFLSNETAIGFGTPRGTGPVHPHPPAFVEKNSVFENWIENAKFAFRFGADARDNYAAGNTLVNVSTVAEDLGTGNQY